MDKQKTAKFYKIIRIIGDIVFIPFFIIILISSIIMYKAKMNNEVPSLFGYSAVKILSGSMAPDFKENDVVVVKVVDPKTLNVGDVIAFYNYLEPQTDRQDLEDNAGNSNSNSSNSNTQTNASSLIAGGARNENQKRVAPYSKVYFHRIVKISTPSNPDDKNYEKLFFQTKGDANGSVDSNWIMEDYVVGVYVSNNGFVSGFFQFCSSIGGSITLIIIPSLIIGALLVITLIGEIKKYKKDQEIESNEQEKRNQILDEITEKKDEENKAEKQKPLEQKPEEKSENVEDKKAEEKKVEGKPDEKKIEIPKEEDKKEEVKKPEVTSSPKQPRPPKQPKPVKPKADIKPVEEIKAENKPVEQKEEKAKPKAPPKPVQPKSAQPKQPVPPKKPTAPKKSLPPKAPNKK